MRLAAKHPRARSSRFTSRKDDLSIHFDGIKGEYAVTKLFLLPFDPKPLPGGDKGAPDLILPDGTSVSVKFREKPEYDYALSTDNPDEFNSDVGILTARAHPELMNDDVMVVGWITRDEFLERATIQNYTQRDNGNRLAVSPADMRSIRELMEIVLYSRIVA
jgi:hypothetical protein